MLLIEENMPVERFQRDTFFSVLMEAYASNM
jgi:hypothetical protein